MFDAFKPNKKKEKQEMEFQDIKDGAENVVRSYPVPEFADPISGGMKAWRRRKSDFEKWLQAQGIDNPVDEVALMFDDEEKMNAFLRAAVAEPGVKMFNYAIDHVRTDPIHGEYWVEYCFLEAEGLGMRVEVMRILRGTSPLHTSLMSYADWTSAKEDHNPVVVHFSFKVPRAKYEETRAAMVGGGAVLAQSCSSDYGRFAYYRLSGTEEHLNLFLKPRINTRDPDEPDTPLPDTTKAGDRGDFGMPGLGKGLGALIQDTRRPIKDIPQA